MTRISGRSRSLNSRPCRRLLIDVDWQLRKDRQQTCNISLLLRKDGQTCYISFTLEQNPHFHAKILTDTQTHTRTVPLLVQIVCFEEFLSVLYSSVGKVLTSTCNISKVLGSNPANSFDTYVACISVSVTQSQYLCNTSN